MRSTFEFLPPADVDDVAFERLAAPRAEQDRVDRRDDERRAESGLGASSARDRRHCDDRMCRTGSVGFER